jgi:hypothetical protein
MVTGDGQPYTDEISTKCNPLGGAGREHPNDVYHTILTKHVQALKSTAKGHSASLGDHEKATDETFAHSGYRGHFPNSRQLWAGCLQPSGLPQRALLTGLGVPALHPHQVPCAPPLQTPIRLPQQQHCCSSRCCPLLSAPWPSHISAPHHSAI